MQDSELQRRTSSLSVSFLSYSASELQTSELSAQCDWLHPADLDSEPEERSRGPLLPGLRGHT